VIQGVVSCTTPDGTGASGVSNQMSAPSTVRLDMLEGFLRAFHADLSIDRATRGALPARADA